MNKAIEIASFNVPYPPDYGGVIDVFYKIKTLKEFGLHVTLHTFSYGRKITDELRHYCDKIFVYERKRNFLNFLSPLPFIVKTRNNNELLHNLQETDKPIIFEGIHTTYPLFADNNLSLKSFLRAHNIETNYYRSLAQGSSLEKKLYFTTEWLKLKVYEPSIFQKVNGILSISSKDCAYLEKFNKNTTIIYPFHKYDKVYSQEGTGQYIVFHGDFTIKQNLMSLIWLDNNVFTKIKHNVIISGKMTKKPALKATNVHIVPNPSDEQMDEIIRNSHICLLHSFNDNGFKLKLLYSLFTGRFCIANSATISDPKLEKICTQANTPTEFITGINELFTKKFSSSDIELRQQILTDFTNSTNCEKLLNFIHNCQIT